MLLQVIDNVSLKMESFLSREIEANEDIRIAVAYISRYGLSIVEEALEKAIKNGNRVEFLVGLDMRVTEPAALSHLYGFSSENPEFYLYCYATDIPTEIFHPKLYLFKTANSFKAIVGSSNLTKGGLKSNIEVNVFMSTDGPIELMSDLYETYNLLKFHKNRVIPDDEFIELYKQVCRRKKEIERNLAKDEHSQKLKRTYREKLRSLHRPKPTRKDLVGWLELVYDSLPEGEFINSDVYKNEGYYQENYPENLNIRAKVRQQLQELRNLGFIEHLGKARWRKL